MFKNKKRLPVFHKNRDKLNWKVPALFCNDDVMFHFLNACDAMDIKLPIAQVYGSIKSSWSGGRTSKIREFNKDKAQETIEKYNKRGIGCSFTFSNFHITENLLDDTTANSLLEIASLYDNNYAIVSSDILADYIRKNYPKIKLEASILKPVYEIEDYIDTPLYYNNLCEKFDKVVIRPEFCQETNFLKKLKQKNKIDIMVNLDCVYKCPYSRKHYDMLADIENDKAPDNFAFCNARYYNPVTLHQNVFLSNKEIDAIIKMGFTNFKLRGRNVHPSEFLNELGIYIFDSSGVFQYLKRYVCLKMNKLDVKTYE